MLKPTMLGQGQQGGGNIKNGKLRQHTHTGNEPETVGPVSQALDKRVGQRPDC